MTRPPEWAQSQYGDTMTEEAIAAKKEKERVPAPLDRPRPPRPRAPRPPQQAHGGVPLRRLAPLHLRKVRRRPADRGRERHRHVRRLERRPRGVGVPRRHHPPPLRHALPGIHRQGVLGLRQGRHPHLRGPVQGERADRHRVHVPPRPSPRDRLPLLRPRRQGARALLRAPGPRLRPPLRHRGLDQHLPPEPRGQRPPHQRAAPDRPDPLLHRERQGRPVVPPHRQQGLPPRPGDGGPRGGRPGRRRRGDQGRLQRRARRAPRRPAARNRRPAPASLARAPQAHAVVQQTMEIWLQRAKYCEDKVRRAFLLPRARALRATRPSSVRSSRSRSRTPSSATRGS